MESFLIQFKYIVSNFEGTIGNLTKAKNQKGNSLCFNILDENLNKWGKFPFNAINLENNHSLDLEIEGKNNTINWMSSHGIKILTWESSPNLIHIENKKIAIISINEINQKENNKYELLIQKIKLSHLLADVVILNIHWGIELQNWPNTKMTKQARWYIDNGIDIIIGHHPHVIIPPVKNLSEKIQDQVNNIWDYK